MAFEQLYSQWVNLAAHEADLTEELRQIQNDPKALEERFYKDLDFGTGGMRGIIGAGRNRINIFTIRRAAQGLANHLLSDENSRGKCVAIGFDSRKYSDRFAKETALILAARGIKACLFESLRPVPLLSFAVRHVGACAGVVMMPMRICFSLTTLPSLSSGRTGTLPSFLRSLMSKAATMLSISVPNPS